MRLLCQVLLLALMTVRSVPHAAWLCAYSAQAHEHVNSASCSTVVTAVAGMQRNLELLEKNIGALDAKLAHEQGKLQTYSADLQAAEAKCVSGLPGCFRTCSLHGALSAACMHMNFAAHAVKLVLRTSG